MVRLKEAFTLHGEFAVHLAGGHRAIIVLMPWYDSDGLLCVVAFDRVDGHWYCPEALLEEV